MRGSAQLFGRRNLDSVTAICAPGARAANTSCTQSLGAQDPPKVAYEYMNRIMIWNGLSEFLMTATGGMDSVTRPEPKERFTYAAIVVLRYCVFVGLTQSVRI